MCKKLHFHFWNFFFEHFEFHELCWRIAFYRTFRLTWAFAWTCLDKLRSWVLKDIEKRIWESGTRLKTLDKNPLFQFFRTNWIFPKGSQLVEEVSSVVILLWGLIEFGQKNCNTEFCPEFLNVWQIPKFDFKTHEHSLSRQVHGRPQANRNAL